MAEPCVFCRIIRGDEPATVVQDWGDAMAIVPLNPVTPGHLLVIPVQHTRDITEDARVSAMAMRRAAEVAQAPCNIITSAGPEATQSVPHLHLHVVPRVAGDGLALPWTGQRETPMSADEPPVRVLSWDCGEQPDLADLARLVADLSGGRLHLTNVEDTGTQDYAIVLSTAPLDQEAATEVYRQWEIEEVSGG